MLPSLFHLSTEFDQARQAIRPSCYHECSVAAPGLLAGIVETIVKDGQATHRSVILEGRDCTSPHRMLRHSIRGWPQLISTFTLHDFRYTWHGCCILPMHVAYTAGVTGRRVFLMYGTLDRDWARRHSRPPGYSSETNIKFKNRARHSTSIRRASFADRAGMSFSLHWHCHVAPS
jgi:hypothetical protein